MARRKKKTEKVVARDASELETIFTNIANAIREQGATGTMRPIEMATALAQACGIQDSIARPLPNLASVFQSIANVIRLAGISGTMIPAQMPTKILSIVNENAKTKVKYTQESGLPDWEGVITGTLTGDTLNSPYYTIQIPNVQYARQIQIGNKVTYITDAALCCASLTSVTIPESVTSIGFAAFSMSGITEITIPNSVQNIQQYAFSDCANLVSASIGNGVTYIEDEAFKNCTSLTSLTLGNSLESIGDSAFNSCTDLAGQIVFPDSLTEIGEMAFYYCENITGLTFGSGLESIGTQGFGYCSGLECQITLPNGMKTIGEGAFYNCPITGITIPNSVTSIGRAAFYGCSNLADQDGFVIIRNVLYYYIVDFGTDVTIPNSVTTISTNAFFNCSITSITFGSGVTYIDEYAFNYCDCTIFDFRNATSIPTLADTNAFGHTSGSKKIVVPDSLYDSWKAATNWSSTTNGIVTAIISQTDYESPVKTATTFYFSNGTSTESEITGELTSAILVNLGLKSGYSTWVNCPTRVEIGSGVTRLGHNAFQSGKALTEVTMADSVLTMGDRVFQDCDNLTTVTLSNSLTEIGKESFKWSGITGMTIPSSVTTIGSSVFASCNSLNAITFQGKTTTQVQGMTNYNFGLKSGCVVTCSNGTITI